MTYEEFNRFMDEYTDAIMSVVIRNERGRPDQEIIDAKVQAVKAKDALWDAIRAARSAS